jgi:hypothetical protein
VVSSLNLQVTLHSIRLMFNFEIYMLPPIPRRRRLPPFLFSYSTTSQPDSQYPPPRLPPVKLSFGPQLLLCIGDPHTYSPSAHNRLADGKRMGRGTWALR